MLEKIVGRNVAEATALAIGVVRKAGAAKRSGLPMDAMVHLVD